MRNMHLVEDTVTRDRQIEPYTLYPTRLRGVVLVISRHDSTASTGDGMATAQVAEYWQHCQVQGNLAEAVARRC